MKKILWLLIFLSGCATAPLVVLPPPTPESLKNTDSTTPGQLIAKKYLMAKSYLKSGQNQEACKIFIELANENFEPIKDLSTIQIISNCKDETSRIVSILKNFQPQEFSAEEFINQAYQFSIDHNLENLTAKFSLEVINYKKTPNEKIKILQNALNIANKNSDQELKNKIEERLKNIAPRFIETINSENRLKIAKDLENARNYNRAREIYLSTINDPSASLEDLVKAYNSYRLTFKIERKLDIFLDKTYEMENFFHLKYTNDSKNPKLKEILGETSINLAKAVWTEHQPDKAVEIIKRVLDQEIGTENQKANCYLILGLIEIEAKRNHLALPYFKKALELKITDKSLAENIQWSFLWNSYLLKKYNDVVANADKYAKPSINPFFYQKIYFWKGISLLKLNKANEAEEVFNKIASNDPFGYYGILANIQLKKEFEPITSKTYEYISSQNDLFDWLFILEEKTFAQKVLRKETPKYKTIAEREKLMQLYAQADWFQAGMGQITNFPINKRNEVTANFINLIFPTPFLELINTESKKNQIPTELTLSIMRQESSFIPTERSWVDAIGLMQLIPERAKSLAKKHRINYSQPDDLIIPNINIQLGTALLSELSKQYNGKFAQSVAAYNASPDAIKKWETERFSGNYLEFIEMIPYEETRNYIKLVFRNYIIYKRVLSTNNFKISPNFFAEPSLFSEELKK